MDTLHLYMETMTLAFFVLLFIFGTAAYVILKSKKKLSNNKPSTSTGKFTRRKNFKKHGQDDFKDED